MTGTWSQIGRIGLLALYILAATPACQLFKLPALIGHFSEHREQDPSISIVDFLILHYLSGSPRDADYDRDMQLPFKTIDITPANLAESQIDSEILFFSIPQAPVCSKSLPNLSALAPPRPYLATRTEPPEA